MNAYRLDSLIRWGAEATRRAVPGKQMRYGRLMQVTKATACRHLNGDVHSPSTHFLRQLAEADCASAWPLVAEGIAVVNQAQIKAAASAVLEARLVVLDDAEHTLEAAESRAIVRACVDPTPEQLEAAATADIAEAEVQLERGAIRRELAERKRRMA